MHWSIVRFNQHTSITAWFRVACYYLMTHFGQNYNFQAEIVHYERSSSVIIFRLNSLWRTDLVLLYGFNDRKLTISFISVVTDLIVGRYCRKINPCTFYASKQINHITGHNMA